MVLQGARFTQRQFIEFNKSLYLICVSRAMLIRKKHAKFLSYHIVWNGQLYCQKVNFISYHKTGVSYLHVLFHTCKCHFIPHRYYFIPTHVISYLQQPVSYAKILFHICVRILCACNVSYLNMSLHTFDNLFHSGVHLLYRASPYSAWAVL